MTMKKLLILMLCLAFAMCFVTGCGSTAPADDDTDDGNGIDELSGEYLMTGDYDTIRLMSDDGNTEYTVLNTDLPLDVYFARTIIPDSVPASDEINMLFSFFRDFFFSNDNEQLSNIVEYAGEYAEEIDPERNYNLYYTFDSDIVELTDEYVSIGYTYDWWAGGTNDYGTDGYVFNAETGELYTLTEYLDRPGDEIKAEIIDKLVELDGGSGDIEIDDAKEYDVNEFDWYLQDGKVHVLFDKYELSYGAYGSFEVVLD